MLLVGFFLRTQSLRIQFLLGFCLQVKLAKLSPSRSDKENNEGRTKDNLTCMKENGKSRSPAISIEGDDLNVSIIIYQVYVSYLVQFTASVRSS